MREEPLRLNYDEGRHRFAEERDNAHEQDGELAGPLKLSRGEDPMKFSTESSQEKDGEQDTLLVSPRQEADSPFAYRPDIDGLRAVAVLGVVAYHFDRSLLPGGFTGVDIFFVISGYVVSGSLLKEASPTTIDYFVGFYSRRAKRIVPALLATVLVTAVVLAAVVPPLTPALDGYYLSGMFALVGVANVRYAGLRDSGSYFDDGNGPKSLQLNPFTHTWSLGVEEQFYFLFPLLLLVAHGARVVKTASERPAWCSPHLVLGALVSASAWASAVMTTRDEQLAFYTLPSRFWELGLGAMALQCRASVKEPICGRPLAQAALEALAVILIACAFLFTPEEDGFPFPWAMLSVSGALCFIAAGSFPGAFVNVCLSQELPVYIGKLSYSIYLWHWPVLVMLKWALGEDRASSTKALVCALALAFLLAAVTYHCLETPFRHWHPKRSWLALVALLPAICCLAFVLQAARATAYRGLYLGDLPPAPAPHQSPMPTPHAPHVRTHGSHANESRQRHENHTSGAKSSNGTHANESHQPRIQLAPSCECRVTAPSFHVPPGAQTGHAAANLMPCFTEVEGWHGGYPPVFSEEECFLGPSTVHPFQLDLLDDWRTKVEDCLQPHAPRRRGERLLFLIGDSHIAHFLTAFRAIMAHSFTIRFLASICGFAPKSAEQSYPPTAPYWDTICRDFHEEEMSLLEVAVQPGDVVAVSNIAAKLPAGAAADDYGALVQRMRRLGSARVTVLVLEDTPYLPGWGARCVPTMFHPDAPEDCEVNKATSETYVQPARSVLSSLAQSHSDVLFFDYHDLFCDSDTCGAMIPGTHTLGILDNHHMTEYAAAYVAPFLCSLMKDKGVFAV